MRPALVPFIMYAYIRCAYMYINRVIINNFSMTEDITVKVRTEGI